MFNHASLKGVQKDPPPNRSKCKNNILQLSLTYKIIILLNLNNLNKKIKLLNSNNLNWFNHASLKGVQKDPAPQNRSKCKNNILQLILTYKIIILLNLNNLN